MAIDGALELHVRYPVVRFGVVALVSFSVRPVVPLVPIAINWPWPAEADSDSEVGRMVSAVMASDVPPVTVNVAVPVATDMSGRFV
jgi:hypothetical protein